ncbi:TPR_REGION domain-containing protein [Mesorhizobium escarrei]|uniref:TPR_REGION domain-containing protein n=1 Tax=Mesorhizobium escarrei TaxID=666018 RepID=A0ABM9ECD3_9HYPH|nr:TPR_REGION domain-containing protein [Mesorhizobium escarrei]
MLAASSIGLSRFLENETPTVSLALDPLNVNALIGEITHDLNDTSNAPDLDALLAKAESALRFDLADARLYSLIGEIKYREGKKEEAYEFFDQARKLSKTEIHALQRSIGHSIEIGDLAKAAGEIDILLRRWPDRFPAVAEGLPTILSSPDGYQAVLAAVKAEAPWRTSLFATLGRTPEGLDSANRLLLDLTGSGAPPKSNELSFVINGFINQKRYEPAYRLFLFSLSDEERKLGGYIFNSTFQPVSSGKPFDWQVGDQSGMEVKFVSSEEAVEGESGAIVRFLNTPVKNTALQQYVELPPGSYKISLIASARTLKLPKELFWSIRCVGQASEIARFSIPEGTYNRQALSQEFSVGPGRCPMQLLKLETAAIAESWRFRYVGTLVMHKLSIERLSS